MDTKYVYIDTCVFRNANFCLGNNAFTQFKKLCQSGHFSLVTTAITHQEINRRLSEQASEAMNALEKFRLKTNLLTRLHSSFGADFSSLDKKAIETKLQQAVARYLRQCRANLLKLPKEATTNVFQKYFSIKKPFQEGKKSEFPDAFVIEALHTLGEKVYVISTDDDFSGASSKIIHLRDMGELLHLYNAHASRAADFIRDLIIFTHRQRVDREILSELQRIPIKVFNEDRAAHCDIEMIDIVDAWVVSFDSRSAKVSLLIHFKITGYITDPHIYQEHGIADIIENEEAIAEMEIAYNENDRNTFNIKSIELRDLNVIHLHF